MNVSANVIMVDYDEEGMRFGKIIITDWRIEMGQRVKVLQVLRNGQNREASRKQLLTPKMVVAERR